MNYTPFAMFKRLWRDHLKKRWRMISLGIVFMIIAAAATSAQPILLQFIFDDVFAKKDMTYITYLPLVVIFIFTLQGIATFFATVIMSRVSLTTMNELQINLLNHFVDYDLEFYSKNNTGHLISRIITELLSVRDAVQILLSGVFRQIFTIIGLVAVMFYQSWELTLIALSVFVLVVYPVTKFAKRLRKLAKQFQHENGRLVSRLNEVFQGVRVIKAYQKEEFEKQRSQEIFKMMLRYLKKMNVVKNMTAPIMQFLAGFAVAGVIWYGGMQLISGETTQGELVSFLGALIMLSRPFKAASNLGSSIQSALVVGDKYYGMIDMKPEFIDINVGSEIKIHQGKINFEQVEFKYADGGEVLKNISLEIPAGKKIALAGHSGSGKSTLFNLIMRFYEPTAGKISIDGQNIADCSITSLRKNIALVSQDSFIFDDSVYNNIAYGKENSTENEVHLAAKAAYAEGFINQMPEGYNSEVGQFGGKLSGGQKQRISIARAFLRDAPILLLDEATSALDPVAEREIQTALDLLMKGRTTFMIAHRLSSVMKADYVILLDDGQVVDSGTHDELMSRSAKYKNLFGEMHA